MHGNKYKILNAIFFYKTHYTMSVEDKKKGCNCKGQLKIEATKKVLEPYISFEDKERLNGKITVWDRCQQVMLYILGVVLLPVLFMYIILNVLYHLMKDGSGFISISLKKNN